MTYLKDELDVSTLYVPGAGLDKIPKKIFGDKAICTTLTESKYYLMLNSLDVIADYRYNPFPTGSFDAAYLHYL